MELLVSIISAILAIATSVNAVGDEVLKNKLESQIESVDTIAVREVVEVVHFPPDPCFALAFGMFLY